MITDQTLMSDFAIPPGEFLSDVLEELKMTQLDLAKRMGRPTQAINEIIKGVKIITPETAIQLEKVVSVPASIWTNLEAEYRLIKAKDEESVSIEKETELLPKFPYLELKKQGMVQATRDKLKKVSELRKFFGVSSLKNLNIVEEYNPAFRLATNAKASKESIASWLRTGSVLSEKRDVAKFSKSKLINIIPLIRSLTLEADPNIFLASLTTHLADCGVALVIVPHFPKTYVTGATFWKSPNKAVVMMSLRGSWGDVFWFSLFHEIGHIILHDKRSVFIEGNAKNANYNAQELEADKFASSHLIPDKEFTEFLNNLLFTKESIESFSRKIGIHPGVVTGRLQHNKLLPYTQHPCRVRYKFI